FRLFCCRYSAAWLFDGHFCQTTLSLPKNCRAFVGNSSLLTGQDVQLLYRAYMHAIYKEVNHLILLKNPGGKWIKRDLMG
ncbi:TPA: hypothetical protein ACUJ97_005265, partial [Escherichia coli]